MPSFVVAQSLHYADVDPAAWYADEVRTFLEEGILDASQPNFRPADNASRGEFAKLIIMISGGVLDETPVHPSFNDVSSNDWWHPYVEEVAREGWMLGDGNCYESRPCTMRPADPITRAEAAAVIIRSFGKKQTGGSPAFSDNPVGSWFTSFLQTAADHCILQGDAGARTVRPGSPLNRAEMVVMLYRLDEGRVYPQCR